MLSHPIFLTAVGAVLGFLSGLGVGGGSLLMLWLTAVLNTEPAVARQINLLFFLPCALIACLFRWRQGAFRLKEVSPAILSGCLAAVLGCWLSARIDTAMLRKLLGWLLILTGARELFYRPRKDK